MSGDLAFSLVLNFKDAGSGGARRALDTVQRALKETGTAAQGTAAAGISAFQKLASAREILGIRPEKAIQNELRQTEAAYQRLAASGQASSRELARAQEAMKTKVAELRRELEGTKQAAGGLGPALSGAMAVGAGYQAAKYVVGKPVKTELEYGLALTHVANTLYAGQSVAESAANKQTINAQVMNAVRAAKGGNRDQALDAVRELAASGVFGNDPAAAYAVLPSVMKAAVATDSDAKSMANIAIKARQNMGLANTERVLGMAAMGGILGQFELRDMAKWLPQQMGSVDRIALRGEEGFATLVAANQLAMRTAGSADEAGNNVKNLLNKINSTDTANDLKKLGRGDLALALAAAQAKGVNGFDAFLNLAEQVAAEDPRMKALLAQAKTAKGAELAANLEAQKGILHGSAIGKIVQDMQASGALVAVMNDRTKFNEIRARALGERNTIDSLQAVVAADPASQAALAAAESANAMHEAMSRLTPLVGNAADAFSAFAQAFPGLTATGAGIGTAATATGAALLAGGGGLALGAALGGGGGLAAAGTAALGMAGAALPWVGGALAVGAAGYGLYELVQWLTKDKPVADPPPVKVQLEVDVDVKNGNIVAAVNEAAERKAARH